MATHGQVCKGKNQNIWAFPFGAKRRFIYKPLEQYLLHIFATSFLNTWRFWWWGFKRELCSTLKKEIQNLLYIDLLIVLFYKIHCWTNFQLFHENNNFSRWYYHFHCRLKKKNTLKSIITKSGEKIQKGSCSFNRK